MDAPIRRGKRGAAIVAAAFAVLCAVVPFGAAADETSGSCTGGRTITERPPPPWPPSRLSPQAARVTLAEGAATTVPFVLDVPAAPPKLDVFFLIDTTNSMYDAICGLQEGIADIAFTLRDEGVDAHFGLGEFREYRCCEMEDVTDNFAYRRDRDMGPLNAAFVRALDKVTTGGGSNDGQTAGLAALYQAATGRGQDVAPKGASDADIAPGLDVSFRPDALKVVLTITDVTFRQPGALAGYPGPTFAQASRALRDKGIQQLAISVEEGGIADLRRMARETRALAPDGGVDCDGDGDRDVDAGAPLVCVARRPGVFDPVTGAPEPVDLAPAIVRLLRAARQEASVRLTARAVRDVTSTIAPSSYASVDLLRGNRLRFNVALRCARFAETSATIPLTATVRGVEVAAGSVVVTCLPPVASGFLSGPRGAAGAPGQQASAENVAPQSQAQSQAQAEAEAQAAAQAAARPGAVIVPVPQAQVQTAVAEADRFAFTGRRRDAPGAAFALAASALAVAAAASRVRVQTVRATRKRGGRP